MYNGVTFGQYTESLILNTLSKVIEYRTMIKNIQEFEKVNNNPGIFQEILAFMWESIWFDNLYYDD